LTGAGGGGPFWGACFGWACAAPNGKARTTAIMVAVRTIAWRILALRETGNPNAWDTEMRPVYGGFGDYFIRRSGRAVRQSAVLNDRFHDLQIHHLRIRHHIANAS
jgi:hypothetical protein